MMLKKEHLLLFFILLGVFFRFYGLGDGLLDRDEGIYIVSAIKYHHPNGYDPRLFDYEHPPVSKFLMGMFTRFQNSEIYQKTLMIPPQLFAYTHLVPYREALLPIRLMGAIFGVIGIILVYLVAREIFNKEAALWAAALAAISADLITYSRIVYQDIYVSALVLFSVLIYLKYAKSGSNALLVPFTLFLAFTFGSKALMPLFLGPALIAAHYLKVKNISKTLPLALSVILAFLTFYYVIYPEEIREVAIKGHYGTGNLLQLLRPGFAMPYFLESFFFRNSYIFAFCIFLSVWMYRKEIARPLGSVRAYLSGESKSFILFSALFISFLFFSFTEFGFISKQVIFLGYVPLMVFFGKPLSAFCAERRGFALCIALLAVSAFAIALSYPYFTDYANFGNYDFVGLDIHASSHLDALRDLTSLLAGFGNPPIITNDQNLIYAYPGIALPILPPYDPECTDSRVESLAGNYVVWYQGMTHARDFASDEYVCPFMRAYNLTHIATFETKLRTSDDPIYVYRINR